MIGVLGVVALCSSTWRYFHVQHLLLEGRFEPNVVSIMLVITLVAVVITWAFVMHFNHERKIDSEEDSVHIYNNFNLSIIAIPNEKISNMPSLIKS